MTTPTLAPAEIARCRAEEDAARRSPRYVPPPPPHRPNPDVSGPRRVGADPALAGFRAQIKAHRARLGRSQEDCAADCEMDHSLLSRLESGHRTPTRAAIGKLATGMRLTNAERDQLLVAADYKPDDPAALLADEPVVTALYQALRRGGLAPAVGDALRAAVGSATALAAMTVATEGEE